MSELENSLSDLENDISTLEDSTLEDSFMDESFIKKVDKYNSDWNSSFLFNGFNTRAVIKKPENNCLIERETIIQRLKRKLEREIGEEDEDWAIDENPNTGFDELYLPDSGTLTMWIIRDPIQMKKIFDVIYEAE